MIIKENDGYKTNEEMEKEWIREKNENEEEIKGGEWEERIWGE